MCTVAISSGFTELVHWYFDVFQYSTFYGRSYVVCGMARTKCVTELDRVLKAIIQVHSKYRVHNHPGPCTSICAESRSAFLDNSLQSLFDQIQYTTVG